MLYFECSLREKDVRHIYPPFCLTAGSEEEIKTTTMFFDKFVHKQGNCVRCPFESSVVKQHCPDFFFFFFAILLLIKIQMAKWL